MPGCVCVCSHSIYEYQCVAVPHIHTWNTLHPQNTVMTQHTTSALVVLK